MTIFSDLLQGDMFNTITGRYVKVSDSEAICVMSQTRSVGLFYPFRKDASVVVLYSAKYKEK